MVPLRALHKDILAGCDQDSSAASLCCLSTGPGTKLRNCLFQPPCTKECVLSRSLCYTARKACVPAVALGLGTENHGAFVEDSGFVKV